MNNYPYPVLSDDGSAYKDDCTFTLQFEKSEITEEAVILYYTVDLKSNYLKSLIDEGFAKAISGNVKNNTSTEFSQNYNDNIFSQLNKGKNQIDDEEKKANLLSQKKVDEFLTTNAGDEGDFDEVKQIEKQMVFLKKELKETRNAHEQLTEQVKELIKNVKCDGKNKIYIEQICQILNIPSEITKKILANNKKGIKI